MWKINWQEGQGRYLFKHCPPFWFFSISATISKPANVRPNKTAGRTFTFDSSAERFSLHILP